MTYDFFRKKLLNKQTTCKDSLEDVFCVIEETKDLNIVIETFQNSARKKAIDIDARLHSGKKIGSLAGMLIMLKDNLSYEGHNMSASSKMLDNFEAIYSSTVVKRLIKEDAIIVGRVSCDEFAMGGSNKTSYYGPVKNPVDITRVPGGSSGGSAAAVKAGLCHVSIGSDTGGSVRQPASFCGVIGFKPSYGVVSRHGLISFASSFDQIGPIGNTIEDINSVMSVISGQDEFDDTLTDIPVKFNNNKNRTPSKIAYIKDFLDHKGLDEEVKKDFLHKVAFLKQQGHEVTALDFSYTKQLLPTYYILTTAEASSNLSRYDGVHFGFRAKGCKNLEEVYTQTRSQGFGTEVKRRILLGTYVLSKGYYDSYYGQAQKVRRIITEYLEGVFNTFDFIISPTSPNAAFKIDEEHKNPVELYLQDIYTVMANIAGIPAISIPLYETEKESLPVGFQVFGPQYKDENIMTFSKQLLDYSWH